MPIPTAETRADITVRTIARTIVLSTALGIVKVLAGWLGRSQALMADGIESILDVVSGAVVWAGARAAIAPPTEQHPYGYGKAEPLSAVIVSMILLSAAAAIAVESVRGIVTPHGSPAPFTLVVLVLVVLAKEAIFRALRRRGRMLDNPALEVEAWHHRSDALTSLAAFVGVSVAVIGGEPYAPADDIAALAAAAVIALNAVRLLHRSWRGVLDVAPPDEVINRIRDAAREVPGVVDLDQCRTRKTGYFTWVDLHVVVDGGLSVAEGHEIAHAVKDAVAAAEPTVGDTTVHIEPYDPEAYAKRQSTD